jgi:hypothetical protein
MYDPNPLGQLMHLRDLERQVEKRLIQVRKKGTHVVSLAAFAIAILNHWRAQPLKQPRLNAVVILRRALRQGRAM